MICNWEDIKDEKWNNLLLGNGFSTNIWKNYSYQSLYKYSIDNSIDPPLIESIQNIFKNLQDINFEEKFDSFNDLFARAEVENSYLREVIEEIQINRK